MPGLGASFGRGGATTYLQDLSNADCVLIQGSNMAEAHPVGFQWVMEAKRKGATVIHVDPRFTRTSAVAVLGWTPCAAQTLMGDAVEINYRLPRLWSLVLAGRVPVHLARQVAQHTRPLAHDAARWADRLVCADPAHLDRVRVAALVREARLFHEPDLVVGEEEDDLTSRRVDLFPGHTPATTEVVMKLDTRDADAFDRAVSQTAAALKELGDADPLGVRRARAVGVLADPQRALDLLTSTRAQGTDPGQPVGQQALKPEAVLWLHVTEATLRDLDTHAGAVDAGPLGCLSTDLVQTWLTGSTVVVRPVLDLARDDAVDAHDPPPWMADPVRLRDPCCVFPGCRRRSRGCDLDHIVAYISSTRAGHPIRPGRPTSPPCVGDTTGPRPTPTGTTAVATTAATAGPHPPVEATKWPPDLSAVRPRVVSRRSPARAPQPAVRPLRLLDRGLTTFAVRLRRLLNCCETPPHLGSPAYLQGE